MLERLLKGAERYELSVPFGGTTKLQSAARRAPRAARPQGTVGLINMLSSRTLRYTAANA